MTVLALVFGFAVSYFIGSIPFGYILSASRGIDIRTVGSGNIGATNVYRILGRKYAVFTFLLDVVKGIAAVRLCAWGAWVIFVTGSAVPEYAEMIAAGGVLIGHSFPIFLGFKGGKGVATGLGSAIGVAPAAAGIGALVWLIVFRLTGYVSAGSLFAAAAVAAGSWFLDGPRQDPQWLVPALITLLAVIVVIRHKSNIIRLIHGRENRFRFGKDK